MASVVTKWHLLLFADGSFDIRGAGRRLKRQAEASNFFSSISLNNKDTLANNHNEFYRQFRRFIRQNRMGYGKWIWKPYLILKKLEEIPLNHGVLYLDSGCILNTQQENARLRLLEYFSLAEKHGSLAMQLRDLQFSSSDLTDLRHSAPFLSDFPSISTVHLESNQVQAGIVFFLKNEKNIEFVSNWYKLTSFYCQLLSQDNYIHNTTLPLREFRWDQSVFSLLYKESGMYCLPDETYFAPNWFEGRDHPIWAMRWKRGWDPFCWTPRDIPTRIISFLLGNAQRIIAAVKYRSGLALKVISRS